MLNQQRKFDPNMVSLAMGTALVVITFALIGFVALSVVTGNTFSEAEPKASDNTSPQIAVAPAAFIIGTPDPQAMRDFNNKGMGFKLQYPQTWQKAEQGLQVIISPSTAGLTPDNVQDAALWVGIPPDNLTDAVELLRRTQNSLAPNYQILDNGARTIGGHPWQVATIQFDYPPLGGQAIALIAATNRSDVGYYLIGMAPAGQWDRVRPQFQAVLDSFDFTTEAVLRPTDATPPPTPTATPTPVIYVVQSGDTLLKIAGLYGVEVEALARRNSIDDPRALRTGAALIIPIKRR